MGWQVFAEDAIGRGARWQCERDSSTTDTALGPGNTISTTTPQALGNTAGYILTISMPAVATGFGFGFAVSDFVATAAAVTISSSTGPSISAR